VSYYPPVPPLPPPGSAPPRPTTVTIAAGLMLVMAVLEFISAALSIAVTKHVDDVLASYGTSTGTTQYSLYGSIIGGIIAVILLVALAIVNLRGQNWARIVAFVVAGLGIACCGCGSVSLFSAGALMSSASQQAGVENPYPGWYIGSAGSIEIIGLLLSVAVIILLAMRQSSTWYAAMSGNTPPQPQPPYPPQQYPPQYPGY
jgi:hypothetical protein